MVFSTRASEQYIGFAGGGGVGEEVTVLKTDDSGRGQVKKKDELPSQNQWWGRISGEEGKLKIKRRFCLSAESKPYQV